MEFASLDVERDSAALADIARQSMQTSYALSPEQIRAVVEEEFGEEVLSDKSDRSEVVFMVARRDGDIEGFAEGEVTEDGGNIRWLHVDPEARGGGVGTALFEHLRREFEERDVSPIRGTVLSEDWEGSAFCERFGFVRVDGTELDLGGQTLSAEVYAGPDADVDDIRERYDPLEDDEEPPGRAETDDGTEVFVDSDEQLSGSISPFFPAYEDDGHEKQYGYFCGGCRTVTTSVDQQERIVCPECGNHHRPDNWDGSYL